MSIKIGDTIETYGWLEGITGVVTKVTKGYTIEDHGTIEIRVVDVIPGRPHLIGLEIGDLEHFVYHDWELDLRII